MTIVNVEDILNILNIVLEPGHLAREPGHPAREPVAPGTDIAFC